ncbi:hypothetical protein SRHO_G00201490 [Serrasalmus rhombeus]
MPCFVRNSYRLYTDMFMFYKLGRSDGGNLLKVHQKLFCQSFFKPTSLKGNSTGFLRCKRRHSEWVDGKCSILEKLTESELFTVVVMGTRCPLKAPSQSYYMI